MRSLLLGGLSVLAPAPSATPTFEKMVEFHGVGADHFLVEVARGERGLFSCTLPVSVRVSVGAGRPLRTLALLSAKDVDHDGSIRLDEWRVAGRASPVVAGDLSVATIDAVDVDVRDDLFRVEWIYADGDVMVEEIGQGDHAVEEPTPLIR